jgi:Flp pilus assembly pilin Flp
MGRKTMMKKLGLRFVKMEMDAREILKVENPERGATTLEYAVIAMVIVGIVLGAMRALGVSIADVFERAASSLGG